MNTRLPHHWPIPVTAAQAGPLECPAVETSVLRCLLTFMQAHGYRHRLVNLLGLAPLYPFSEAGLRFAARRFGLQLMTPSAADPGGPAATLLVVDAAGYGTLYLPCDGLPSAIATAPATRVYAIGIDPARRFPRPRLRQPRCWLIPSSTAYRTRIDPNALARLAYAYDAAGIEEQSPGPLAELTIPALLDAHRAMAPRHPQYFGRFRTVEMGQHTLFVRAAAIPVAMAALFDSLSRLESIRDEELLRYAAAVLTDFLTVHPFVNGNRRMGMLLVATLLGKRGVTLDWRRVSLIELYYWIRCAARGHHAGLVRCLQRTELGHARRD